MPKRRTRKTNRKPQEERRLRVRSIRRGNPDPGKLSRAFIELALARAEAEAEAEAQAQAETAHLVAGRDEREVGADGETEDGAG